MSCCSWWRTGRRTRLAERSGTLGARLPIPVLASRVSGAETVPRDQALAAAAAALGASILVFLDDDEADLGWLRRLLLTCRVSGSD